MEELEPMSDLEKSLRNIDMSDIPEDFDGISGDEDITVDDYYMDDDSFDMYGRNQDLGDDEVDDEHEDDSASDNLFGDDEEIDIDELEPDEFTDKAYAKKFIKSRLMDAREEIRHLLDFLEHSDYARAEGGEEFKKYIERGEHIYNELRNFLKH